MLLQRHKRAFRSVTSGALLAVVLALAAAFAPSADAAETLVRYSSGGGLAGQSIDLRVRTDGRARLVDDGNARAGEDAATKRFTLSHAMRRGLRADLRDARLADCEPAYESEFPVADGISQRVSAGGEVVTVSTGGDPPRRLERLLGRLQRIVSRH